jgi:hypothetical protein
MTQVSNRIPNGKFLPYMAFHSMSPLLSFPFSLSLCLTAYKNSVWWITSQLRGGSQWRLKERVPEPAEATEDRIEVGPSCWQTGHVYKEDMKKDKVCLIFASLPPNPTQEIGFCRKYTYSHLKG